MSAERVENDPSRPGGEPAAPPPHRAEPPKSRARWGAWVAVVVLGVVGATFLADEGSEERAPVVKSDVPRVEGDHIALSEAFARRIGLEVRAVREGPLTPIVSVVGTVTLDPEHLAAVGTRLRGLVRNVAKFEGDTVKRGDVLASIDSAELGEAQAAIAMLEAEREAARINAERERSLLDRNLSTAREAEVAVAELKRFEALLDAAKQRVVALGGRPPSGRAKLGSYVLRAPIGGTIIERNIATGQSVEAELVAFKIGDLDHLWVELAVYEQNIGSIVIGDPVTLSLLSNPDVTIEGRVAHVGAQVNPDTRSADVRVEVDNRERKLLPGQAVTADIEASRGAGVAVKVVPKTAVTVVDGQPTVFVATKGTPLRELEADPDTRVPAGETVVRVAEVVLGKSDGEDQQIVAGLEPGELVVVRGVFALKSELFR